MAARIVFSISEVSSASSGLDQARHLEIVRDDALGGKLLQGLEPPAAGGDGVDALLVGRGVNDQVLL